MRTALAEGDWIETEKPRSFKYRLNCNWTINPATDHWSETRRIVAAQPRITGGTILLADLRNHARVGLRLKRGAICSQPMESLTSNGVILRLREFRIFFQERNHVIDDLFSSVLLQKVACTLDQMKSPVWGHCGDRTALVWFECDVFVRKTH